MTIYELIGYGSLYGHKQSILELFGDGLNAYKQRQWTQALTSFQDVLRHDPYDGPAQIYCQRCKEFLDNPPPDDWDGVLVMATK